ncbi:hypothetical protein WKH57_01370 [Niallia taxi]|uniref:hypothetical protein n=1 Tax=Niallia taxi TaxID=2499688 RepID=UPI00317F2AD7
MNNQEIITLLKDFSSKGDGFDPESGIDVKEIWEKISPKHPEYKLAFFYSQYAQQFQATLTRDNFEGDKPVWIDSFHVSNPYVAVCESLIKLENLI